jgi:hypothetical protein
VPQTGTSQTEKRFGASKTCHYENEVKRRSKVGRPDAPTNGSEATHLRKDGKPVVKTKSSKKQRLNLASVIREAQSAVFQKTASSAPSTGSEISRYDAAMGKRLKSALENQSIRDPETWRDLTHLLTLLICSPESFHAGTVRNVHDGKTVLIDYDVPFNTQRKGIVTFVRAFLAELEVEHYPFRVRKSSSGRCHVVVKLRKSYNDFAILFIQLYCGSDHKREACNFIRFQFRTDPHSQILFGKKIPLDGGKK